MSEMTPKQDLNQNNERPLGRFLLSRAEEPDRERLWHRGAYAYAQNFVTQYHDQLRSNGSSHIVAAEIDDGGEVTIPHGTPDYERAIWLEFDRSQDDPGYYTWRVTAGSDEYDIDLYAHAYTVTKYELTAQGNVLRRAEVADQDVIEGLQALVESVIAVANIDAQVVTHRKQCQLDQQEYEHLSRQSSLSLRQRKEKASLKKSAVQPYFHAGSIGHRNKHALLG